jgi:hypothetical protein
MAGLQQVAEKTGLGTTGTFDLPRVADLQVLK